VHVTADTPQAEGSLLTICPDISKFLVVVALRKRTLSSA
jgi:hypothetical protein